MTVREAYAMAVSRLTAAAVESPQAEAWLMLEELTGSSRARLITDTAEIGGATERRLGEWLARRSLREPLQLIIGASHFYGLRLACEPGVLIPRPETERLVEIGLGLIRDIPDPRVLDVGAGTGAIALAVKNERPRATVMATDIAEGAVDLTRRNASALGLDIETVQSALLEDERVRSFASEAHLIVSNPPYLPFADKDEVQAEVRWDPDGALYAGEDGLGVYRELAKQAAAAIRAGSVLLVELDPRNVHLAAEEANGWSEVRVHEDLTGRPRFLQLTR